MRVISRRPLRVFWEEHGAAEEPLRAWAKHVERVSWKNFADVRAGFATADKVGHFTVFNIGGNKYRLVVVIDYSDGITYVRHVLTHAEYDAGNWKKDEFGRHIERKGRQARSSRKEKDNGNG